MSRLTLNASIAKPCQQQWSSMPGSASQRHCDSCEKTVHNFAALTPREIESLIHETPGPLCARITRHKDGSLVTANAPRRQAAISSAFFLATALAASPAVAQDPATPQAIVTGIVLLPHYKDIDAHASREVLFIQNEKIVSTISTDGEGKFTASVPIGTYDVVFRTGPLFGERVKNAEFHAGHQEFAPVQERFNYGHLGEIDHSVQTFVTMGEMVSTLGYRVTPRNLLFHPIGTARTLAWHSKHLLHL